MGCSASRNTQVPIPIQRVSVTTIEVHSPSIKERNGKVKGNVEVKSQEEKKTKTFTPTQHGSLNLTEKQVFMYC